MSKKIVDVKLTGGHWHGINSNGWRLSVTDTSSGLLICEITLTPDQFYGVMASHGATPASAVVWDTFDNIGKDQEISRITLQDDRLKEMRCDHVAVVHSRLAEIETDGRICDIPYTLSRDQLNRTDGTIRLTLRKYVEPAEVTA